MSTVSLFVAFILSTLASLLTTPWLLVFYTRLCLPLAGKCVGRGWHRVGSFLGQNIDDFWQRFPDNTLAQIWESAGFSEVTMDRKSLGGGVIMTGRKI
jgi:hypothetical protein